MGRDTVQAHLAALEELDDLDLVSQDLLIGHAGELEKFQWFVRAHLENSGGQLSHRDARTEKQAAAQAKKKPRAK